MPEIRIDTDQLKEMVKEVVKEVIQDEMSKLRLQLRPLFLNLGMGEKKEAESRKNNDDDFDNLEFETLGL
jgi:hypothetical protein